MKKFFSLILLIAVCNQTHAQESNSKIHRIKFSDVEIQSGICWRSSQYLWLNDFKNLAPNSNLLIKIPNTNSQWRPGYSNPIHSFLVSTEVQFGNKNKNNYRKNPSLRVGLSSHTNTYILNNFGYEEGYTYDALFTSQGELFATLDSMFIKTLWLNHHYNQVSIDASLNFHTQTEKRFSFYAGIGISIGKSLNSSTHIIYNEFTTTQITFWDDSAGFNDQTSNNFSSWNSPNSGYETYSNKNNTTFWAYIPAGVDMRFGKKKYFWKNLHLTYEIQGGLTFFKVPELTTYRGEIFSISLGLKFSW